MKKHLTWNAALTSLIVFGTGLAQAGSLVIHGQAPAGSQLEAMVFYRCTNDSDQMALGGNSISKDLKTLGSAAGLYSISIPTTVTNKSCTFVPNEIIFSIKKNEVYHVLKINNKAYSEMITEMSSGLLPEDTEFSGNMKIFCEFKNIGIGLCDGPNEFQSLFTPGSVEVDFLQGSAYYDADNK